RLPKRLRGWGCRDKSTGRAAWRGLRFCACPRGVFRRRTQGRAAVVDMLATGIDHRRAGYIDGRLSSIDGDGQARQKTEGKDDGDNSTTKQEGQSKYRGFHLGL